MSSLNCAVRLSDALRKLLHFGLKVSGLGRQAKCCRPIGRRSKKRRAVLENLVAVIEHSVDRIGRQAGTTISFARLGCTTAKRAG